MSLAPLTVAGDELTTETTGSEVAFALDHERIERIPEESRNFIELAQLVPGATAGADGLSALPSPGTRGSAVGALNQQSFGVLVDGGDLTEPLFGDLGGSLPLLAVQEFEVVESQYSAAPSSPTARISSPPSSVGCRTISPPSTLPAISRAMRAPSRRR